jgi:disulfide bond formation protein DsbB
MAFIVQFIANLFAPIVLVATAMALILAIAYALTFTSLRPRVSLLVGFFKRRGLLSGFVIALGATSGSLFYSEVLGYTPCLLCWYQRILMYPLVALFATAIITKARDAHRYVLALSIPGFLLAGYHYLVQIFDITTNCTAPGGRELIEEAGQCTMRYVFDYGFISIPFMAAVAFALITFVSLFALSRDATRRHR